VKGKKGKGKNKQAATNSKKLTKEGEPSPKGSKKRKQSTQEVNDENSEPEVTHRTVNKRGRKPLSVLGK